MTSSRAFIVVAATALLVAGCGGSKNDAGQSSGMSNAQAPPERLVVDVSITGDKVVPENEQLKAAVNEQIVVNVSSDVEDELHVHSNPEHSFEIKPGPRQTFQFSVAVPGRVDVELHKANTTIATIAVK